MVMYTDAVNLFRVGLVPVFLMFGSVLFLFIKSNLKSGKVKELKTNKHECGC